MRYLSDADLWENSKNAIMMVSSRLRSIWAKFQF